MRDAHRRRRFLDILWNRKTDDGGSLLDLFYPCSDLLSLIPPEFHKSLGISSDDLHGLYGPEEVFRVLGAFCRYQIGIALSEKEKGLAYGFFLIYSQNFLPETDNCM